MERPTLTDVLLARQVVGRYLDPTPLVRAPLLEEELGVSLHIKVESLLPTHAFKVRGGLYLMSTLSEEEKARGVVAVSTGNHGQSIAYAARAFGVKAIIFAPEGSNPVKVAAMEALGAAVRLEGKDFDAARERGESFAKETGARYIHSANEPALIAGVGTYALEMWEKAPHLDAIVVPVGAGTGIGGVCTVWKTLSPTTKIIGVQAQEMPAVYRSFKERELVALAEGHTFADGLATRVAFSLPLSIMWEKVDDMVLVSEEDMAWAIEALAEKGQLLAEGAGAASLAAIRHLAGELQGKEVGMILSGGNITAETLSWALSVYQGKKRVRTA
ncbi:MAG: threonine/serine dehydratase [Bacillota bacterium]|nr:threonine/serine dehydratase [Bacillota bacterium]